MSLIGCPKCNRQVESKDFFDIIKQCRFCFDEQTTCSHCQAQDGTIGKRTNPDNTEKRFLCDECTPLWQVGQLEERLPGDDPDAWLND